MIKLTLCESDVNQISELEYAITKFANDRIAEMIEVRIDFLEDGMDLSDLLPRRIELYHPEYIRPILYELWDTVRSGIVYEYLSPLMRYVLYQIMDQYIEDWKEEPEELHFSLHEELKARINIEKDNIVDDDTRESEYLISVLESAEDYPDIFFEDTDFLEENLRRLVSLAMSNPAAFRVMMGYDELDTYIEIMPGDLAMQYQAFREKQIQMSDTQNGKYVFISHRSIDKEVADMLADFLIATGIQRDTIRCSSLPENDVKVKISTEVREWIMKSAVNIAILSHSYYQSAYCHNEAGILWYLENTTVIPIALPEIGPDDMLGFLNNDYRLRRLDSDGDIAYIYDTIREKLDVEPAKHSVITIETAKLKKRYLEFCMENGS